MKVTLLFFDGCPNWRTTNANLEALAGEFRFDFDRCQVETNEDAQRLQFRGSPTVLIDGRDVFADGDEPIGLSCRMYRANTASSARRASSNYTTRSPQRTHTGSRYVK